MLKKPSLLGKEAGRYLLIASMTGLMVGCGGSGTGDAEIDTDPGGETPISEQDLDRDGIPNGLDNDADDDGLDDFNGEDNFVDWDEDGEDDITFLSESEANATTFLPVSPENPCGSQRFASDNNSSTPDWNDNCLVKRQPAGQFADSMFSVGIQRVLFCSGFAKDEDYEAGKDYTDFADGEYGEKSETAALAFQRAELIAVDGVVGPQTWGRLQGRVEWLDEDTPNDTSRTYGFSTGPCEGIPMFYQSVTTSNAGTVLGGWTLARNEPNETQTAPFNYLFLISQL